MARPRKYENNGLPQNLLCRRRKRANGSIVEYYFYVLADGKERSLGTNKHEAILEAAKLNFENSRKSPIVLFIDVAKRYELEVVPTKKAKNTHQSNLQAIHWLCKFFGNPPAPLEKIEPKHISQYLQWRKDTPAVANIEVGLFNTIWNMAREWGYTALPSPSQGVKKFPTKYREVYVEDYILDKIYEFADERMADIIETAYLLGQRPIDICNIHRSHIYDGILHITQQKTGKKVRFEISGRLKEILDKRLGYESDWIFTNKWGKKLKRRSLGDHFKEIRERAMKAYPELADEIAKVQMRDMRAKAATDISLMTTDEQAQKQLGHTSKRMTHHYIRKDKILKPTDEIT
ncbi:tyrosine-type recombinase/integrase [Mannheimia haemolytica]|uniref:tyrosine-type recombinase/integrase n=1 Tax=Mannheimia haemolytica TaxID=75985 RepID=UPI0032081A78